MEHPLSLFVLISLICTTVLAPPRNRNARVSRRQMKEICRGITANGNTPKKIAAALSDFSHVGALNREQYSLSVLPLELQSNGKYLISWEVIARSGIVGNGSVEVSLTGNYLSDLRMNLVPDSRKEGIGTAILGIIALHAPAGCTFGFLSLNHNTNRRLSEIRVEVEKEPYFDYEIDGAVYLAIKALEGAGNRDALPLWIRVMSDVGFTLTSLEARPRSGEGTIVTGTENYRFIFEKPEE